LRKGTGRRAHKERSDVVPQSGRAQGTGHRAQGLGSNNPAPSTLLSAEALAKAGSTQHPAPSTQHLLSAEALAKVGS